MDIWKILGIPQTSDPEVIHQAYARKLKELRSEDTEDARQLSEAYQAAQRLAHSPSPAAETAASPLREPPSQPVPDGLSQEPPAIQHDSMEDHPAVTAFRALYTGKQRQERKQWDLYFTSPEFLEVWREADFTAALAKAVDEAGENCPPNKAFQTALAAAYQYQYSFTPDGMRLSAAPGTDFEGIEAIFSIAARGPVVRPVGNDLILSVAYADYLKLLNMAPDGVWTDEALYDLDELLGRYSSFYIKEKCTGNPEVERNAVSLRLLNCFFARSGLPVEVYDILWNELDLNSAIMGRAKALYGRLRELCLERAPQICVQRENFTELVNAYEAVANGGKESRRLVDEFFAREDFGRAIRNRSFVKHHSFWALAGSKLFLERLIDLYEEHPELPLSQMMKEKAQSTLLSMERIRQRAKEAQRLERLAESPIARDDCTLTHPLFLRWFLHAFFLQADDQGHLPKDSLKWDLASIPRWDRALAAHELTRSLSPVSQQDGKSTEQTITATFRQFFIEYRCGGCPVSQPVLSFRDMKHLEDDPFFLFMPLMSAFPEEQTQVAEHIRERLVRLPIPKDLIDTLASAMAADVACLTKATDDTLIVRPAFFGQERDGVLYFCKWYPNRRLVTYRHTTDGSTLLPEHCHDGIFDIQQAQRLSASIFDELCVSNQTLTLSADFQYHTMAEYFQSPCMTWAPNEMNNTLFKQLIYEFQKKRISRLVFSIDPLLSSGKRLPKGQTPSLDYIVLLWNSERLNAVSTCALMYFSDRREYCRSLVFDRNMYMTYDSKSIPWLSFRMGSLPAYSVHQAPEKAVSALTSLLDGSGSVTDGQWSEAKRHYSSQSYYYAVQWTLGGFPYDRERIAQRLFSQYVISKAPVRFSATEPDGTVENQEITTSSHSRPFHLLPQLQSGRLDRLVLTWELESGPVHLVLRHRMTDAAKSYLAAVIQDAAKQIDYLVADIPAYLDDGASQHTPLVPFQELQVQSYLIHEDYCRVRDFLDCFLGSMPDYQPILRRPFGEFSDGPVKRYKKLFNSGFTAHRAALLGETQ